MYKGATSAMSTDAEPFWARLQEAGGEDEDSGRCGHHQQRRCQNFQLYGPADPPVG